MEGKKKTAASASSFTADLFGSSKEPLQPASSAGIFASIFPPPATVLGRKSSGSEIIGSWQKQASVNQAWNAKQENPGNIAMNGEAAQYNVSNKDGNYSFQEERMEPCHLSSSLYYGGQDHYSQSPSPRSSESYPIFKKDGGEDDPNGSSASRGNWWQGTVVYRVPSIIRTLPSKGI